MGTARFTVSHLPYEDLRVCASTNAPGKVFILDKLDLVMVQIQRRRERGAALCKSHSKTAYFLEKISVFVGYCTPTVGSQKLAQ